MRSPQLTSMLLNCSREAADFAANWMVQSTFLLFAGLLIGRLLIRRGSAVQSLVYRTTLVVVLVCPLAAWTASKCGVSGWSIRLQSKRSDDANVVKTPPQIASRHHSETAAAIDSTADLLSIGRVTPISISGSGNHSAPDIPPAEKVTTDRFSRHTGLFQASTSDLIGISLCLLWSVITGWLCLRLARAWAVMLSIRRSAIPAAANTLDLCNHLAKELCVPQPEVRCSPFISIPCITGFRCPMVLLPDSDLKLSASDVLMHELAHLKRRDLHWTLFRELATAVFFFQPLLWKLSRRLEATAEEVCDDIVVKCGGDRREYANRLVDVAELAGMPVAMAVAIASLHSTLAGRIARIMDTSRDLSTGVSHRVVFVTLLIGITATAVVGMVNAGSSPAISSTPTIAIPVEPVLPSSQDAANALIPDVGIVTVSGTVLDPAGQPLPNARIWLQRAFANSLVDEELHHEYKDGSDRDWNEWFAISSTNSLGEFRFDVNSAKWNVGHNPYTTQIAATSDELGFGLASVPAVFDRKEQPKLTIHTAVDQPIEGRIVSSDGQPAIGTAVRLLHVRTIGEPSADEYIADVLAEGSRYSFHDKRSTRVPGMSAIAGRDDVREWHVLTDDDGRFVLRGIGADRIALLTVQGPTVPIQNIWVVTRQPPNENRSVQASGVLRLKREIRGDGNLLPGGMGMGAAPPPIPDRDQYYAHFTHVAEPARILKGVVRDRETKEPVAGVQLDGAGIPVTSGADGRYEIVSCLKQHRYDVHLKTVSGKYLNISVVIPDAPGTGILEYDFFLPRAITARGRVTDRETGEPFEGTVEYNPLFPNAYLDRLHLNPGDGSSSAVVPRSSVAIAEDGSWELQVLPGPGILLVRDRHFYLSDGWQPRQETWTSAHIDMDRLSEVLGGTDQAGRINTSKTFHIDFGHGAFSMGTSGCKALALIRPSVDLLFDSQKVYTQDMHVVRGRDIHGIVLDPEGRPTTDVWVTGLSLESARNIFLKDERFTVSCVSPDVPRRLVFQHHARNLRAEVEIQPDFEGLLTVRLKPAAE